MKTVNIPKFLHEVLGERQSKIEVIAILMFAGIGGFAIFNLADLSLNRWPPIIAFILIVDVLAGCIANFTRGTNNFYAARPKNRIVFIAIHIHLLAIAWLLEAPLIDAFVIWGYTMISALIVNHLYGKKYQHFIAANLMCYGLLLSVFLSLEQWFLLVSLFFMIKVMYSFAVDHYSE
ncbi:hypothetical protein [Thalassotalea fusca]